LHVFIINIHADTSTLHEITAKSSQLKTPTAESVPEDPVPPALDTSAAGSSDVALSSSAVTSQAPAARWRRVLKAALPLQVL
jgi:hypothetical protein